MENPLRAHPQGGLSGWGQEMVKCGNERAAHGGAEKTGVKCWRGDLKFGELSETQFPGL